MARSRKKAILKDGYKRYINPWRIIRREWKQNVLKYLEDEDFSLRQTNAIINPYDIIDWIYYIEDYKYYPKDSKQYQWYLKATRK